MSCVMSMFHLDKGKQAKNKISEYTDGWNDFSTELYFAGCLDDSDQNYYQ